jgi:hypothetical protein
MVSIAFGYLVRQLFGFLLLLQASLTRTTSDKQKSNIRSLYEYVDRLCSLVVRVLGYRSGGPGSIPGTTRKKK